MPEANQRKQTNACIYARGTPCYAHFIIITSSLIPRIVSLLQQRVTIFGYIHISLLSFSHSNKLTLIPIMIQQRVHSPVVLIMELLRRPARTGSAVVDLRRTVAVGSADI